MVQKFSIAAQSPLMAGISNSATSITGDSGDVVVASYTLGAGAGRATQARPTLADGTKVGGFLFERKNYDDAQATHGPRLHW